MRSPYLIAGLLGLCNYSYAQEQPFDVKPRERKNEIGVLSDINLGNSFVSSPVGILYKHWATPNLGYRLLLGYAQYENTGTPSYIGRVGDTVLQSSYTSTIPMAFAGVGLEIQRKFYKRVYLYASLELRGGYGSGWYTTNLTQTVQNDSANYTSMFGVGTEHKGVKMFTIESMPGIGAKIQFKKGSIGTEISLVHMGFRNISYPSGYNEGSGFDFNMGGLSQRFFVTLKL